MHISSVDVCGCEKTLNTVIRRTYNIQTLNKMFKGSGELKLGWALLS